ncbi:MAG: hypothetical protein JWR79_200 [Tardiphaga sp.]|nr:hypothetical protein [Tardiphaga sp.]
MLDPRVTPMRPDLAARYLEGKVEASRFVDGVVMQVVDPLVSIHAAPSHQAEQWTQALLGERVTIYDRDDNGWAWGQLGGDGYVGWLPDSALGPLAAAPTHRVSALRTFAFAQPSIKLPPVAMLPMGALLTIDHVETDFAVTTDRLFIPARHVGARDDVARDFVAIAERFLGTPYLWGGKSSLGIDCSGLVQIALNASGVGCPRDSDMQRDRLGAGVSLSDVRRGDLLFWKGHVAIARDATTMVHANAHHMATAIEPIRDAIARIAAAGSELLAIKRL